MTTKTSGKMYLPYPPTINTYWRNFRGRTVLSKRGRQFKQAVKALSWIEPDCKVDEGKSVGVTVRITFPDKRRRDIDNIAKPILDALTGIAFDDDSQVKSLWLVASADRVEAPGCVEVTWEEL